MPKVTTLPMLHIRLLGGLTLTWDEVPLPSIPNVAARSLLAYLITNRDRRHTRDLLAGTFWPDLPDAVARRRLSRALWEIQRAFRLAQDVESAPPVLLTQGDPIQFNPDLSLWLDVEEFEKLVGQSPDQAADLPVLYKAVELYRGDLLAGYYDDWLLVERERLRGLFLSALEQLVMGHKSRGECKQALVYAQQLTMEDPWREEAHREVMHLCHLLGRDSEALKQFEVCRQVLAEELGVEPSPEMESLVVEITNRADLLHPPVLPLAARPAVSSLLERPDRLTLVGRQPELAELLRQVETATQGNGGLTLVYGEAGVGKTRLVQELAHNAQWCGVQTVWGRCYELAAPPAYQPLVEALRAGLPALREAPLEPLWRAELSRLLPELMVDEALPPPLPPEEDRRRLLEAIARGFLALTGAGPHLVLLEDAHWMDPASLEALRYLLPRLAGVPLRVVLTARGGELDARQAGALIALEGARLNLERLDLAETGELVQRALELERPAPRFSARLHGETEGNPFYVLETLRALADEGLLRRDADGGWSTPWDGATEDYAELSLPAGVIQTIERRLDRLPVTLGELLGLAAVIGRGVAFDLWFQASNRDEEELLAAGDELCARGLFLSAEPDYVFAHDQIRRVTYDRLAAPRRRLYHRQVAQALARLSPDEPEALAYHWTYAEMWDQAADCHRQAGDRARAVYANAKAADHYTQALGAMERLPGPPILATQYQLHLTREAIYDLLGNREAQAQDLETLESLAQTMGDDKLRAEVNLRQGRYAETVGDLTAAIYMAQKAIALGRVEQDVRLEAGGYFQKGRALWRQMNLEAAHTCLDVALELSRKVGLHRVEADSLRTLAGIYDKQGKHARVKFYLEQTLPIYRKIGDRRGESATLNNLSTVARHLGDFVQARAYAEQGLRIKREIGDQRGESFSLLSLGLIAWLLGRYTEAQTYVEQAVSIRLQIGDRWGEADGLVYLGLIAHYLEDDQTAQYHCQQALCIAQQVGDPHNAAAALTYLGHALASQGKLAEAGDVYHQALEIRREAGHMHYAVDLLAGIANISLLRGDLTRALLSVEEILAQLEEHPLDHFGEPFWMCLVCYRVLCAGQDPRAKDFLSKAHDLLQKRAAKISDEDLRCSYLENVTSHREIIVVYRELTPP